MKPNKKAILVFTLALITIHFCAAQIKHVKTETVKVYGNCETCKKNIETAAYKKKVSKALWSIDNKTAILSFDSTKTTADAILKKIAYAGYDNQNYFAPDAAYKKLDQCCQYSRKMPKEVAKSIDTIKTPIQTDTVKKTTTGNANHLSAVYAAYFALKDALAKDDGITAAANAKELYNAIDEVPMAKLTVPQHIVWMKYVKQLSYDAEHIKGVTETAHQREHFISLSKNMYEVMKVIKNVTTVYYDFCPMADGGKGATWLSLQKPILNPYFGKQMLTCGSTKETIPANK